MGPLRKFVLDRWSNLSHKAPMRDDPGSTVRNRVNGWSPQGWIGTEHHHRVTGYVLLGAYLNNVAREFLSTTDQQDIEDRREYGDPALVRDQIVSAVLGETQSVVVQGADDYQEDLDEASIRGDDTGRALTDDEATQLADNQAAAALAERQEFLQEWARDVHLELRMVDLENNAVGMGDGCVLLGWDSRRRRVVPAIVDPGFYFPVLPDSLDGYEYPETVHFAWEIPAEDTPDDKPRVRRITYRLTRLSPFFDQDEVDALPRDADLDTVMRLPEGARWQTMEGVRRLVRDYPWNDEPTDLVCEMSDLTWLLDDLDDVTNVDDFPETRGVPALDADQEPMVDVDLGIDFLPVVHIPNTPPGGDHYGESSIARTLQIFDDLQSADTDAQASSATTGSPITWSSTAKAFGGGVAPPGRDSPLLGIQGQAREVKPGSHWDLGDGGQAGSIDTSTNLAATREYVLHLLDRLAVVARLPAVTLGSVKPSEVPSGFAMQLSFGPLESMVRVMRLVRAVKYPLMLKMVQRIYQANGELPPGPTPRAEINLGAFLPSDMTGTLEMVRNGVTDGVMSLETGIAMLIEVGFPVDDIVEEIQRIQSHDFDGAGQLADATGNQQAVADYLGLDLPEGSDAVTDPATIAAMVAAGRGPIAGGTGVGVPSASDSGTQAGNDPGRVQ